MRECLTNLYIYCECYLKIGDKYVRCCTCNQYFLQICLKVLNTSKDNTSKDFYAKSV